MTDLIDRQAVLGYIERLNGQGTGKGKSLEYLKKYVENLPSAYSEFLDRAQAFFDSLRDAEVTSAWECVERDILQATAIGGLSLLLRYRCKNCGYLSFTETNYCPECGKRMEVDNG